MHQNIIPFNFLKQKQISKLIAGLFSPSNSKPFALVIQLIISIFSFQLTYAQLPVKSSVNQAPKLNPLLPGYFADPTIKKFNGIYYIYSTTDNIMLASGAPTVWYSSDFVNWFNRTMDIPSFSSQALVNFWAPDVMKKGNLFYLYFGNCQMGCNIYGYVSDNPVGPWKKLSEKDTPVIPHSYPRKNFPSLDAQFFTDEDDKTYAYWGTWVHYNGGYAVGQLDADFMHTKNAKNIPLNQTPSPFEAPYLLKVGKKYILMYSGGSCHDDTYQVHYAYADSPYGPFTYGENNPILSSNADGSVHGPGHHSVLKEGNDFYIVYHKHDFPMTRGGMARQVCIDQMNFSNDSTIQKVIPSNTGNLKIHKSIVPKNLASQAKATASSFYTLTKDKSIYKYTPNLATDNHNGTLWKAASQRFPQSLSLDLGQTRLVRSIHTEFEFPTFYYQYRIYYSNDRRHWKLYTDRSKNKNTGSPMIDHGNVRARYLKLEITNTEKQGLLAAVWNMKVYDQTFDSPLALPPVRSTQAAAIPTGSNKLVDINAKSLINTKNLNVKNFGTIGGKFTIHGSVTFKRDETNVLAFKFDKGALISDRQVPQQLSWNGAYSVAVWVRNPTFDKANDCIFSWCNREIFGLANSYQALFYNAGAYGAAAHLDGHYDMAYKSIPAADKWHHIVLTFDGMIEKIYVDGKLDNSQMMTLSSAITGAKMIIGASDVGEHFSGWMASLQFFDFALSQERIKSMMEKSNPKKDLQTTQVRP